MDGWICEIYLKDAGIVCVFGAKPEGLNTV